MTLLNKIQQRIDGLTALRKFWGAVLSETEVPEGRQFDIWLSMHKPERIMDAIRATARKRARLNGEMSLEYMIRYCSRAANSARRDSERNETND